MNVKLAGCCADGIKLTEGFNDTDGLGDGFKLKEGCEDTDGLVDESGGLGPGLSQTSKPGSLGCAD